jgi:1-acyl-sn-glycerol-3-phosphate acyltransferase
MIRAISKFIYFKLIGWKVRGYFPTIKKFIVIVAPHTSNWDFPIGLLGRQVTGIPDVRFLGKAELFKFPYGWIFRSLGGYPVDRKNNNNLVDTVVEIFDNHEEFKLALAPEGTRKKVERFKTGFYHIAKKADVPIVMVGFDYIDKEIRISDPIKTTDNMEKDMSEIMSWFKNIRAKIPAYSVGKR